MNENLLFDQIKNGRIFSVYIFEGDSEILDSKIQKFVENTMKTKLDYRKLVEVIAPENNNISIEKIRKLNQFVFEKPFNNDFKIILIENAHYMGEVSQNALLKTLENIPEYAVVIMTTNNRYRLLDTIISRSQIFSFRGNQKLEVSSEKAKVVLQFLGKCIEANFYNISKEKKIFDELAVDKVETLNILTSFFLETDLKIKGSKEKAIVENIEALSPKSKEKIVLKIEEIKNLLRVNINFKLALENLMFTLINEMEKARYNETK